ncbi:hypothetical protein ABB37_05163 [Leptomonas pyrrhocoris]|uniref:BRCT domain-containing protein n=1 Tax=Leptomonas pyrrhocoris TaxID=157538 RepID=A0A0N0VF44_LEPPY|nr:hypothetical protein ABB37_05163 [Leptomonas pyrrhocoris]KPA80182.1 hypothetical protein ABB37_05163 [Leptomonas pyrrhocoris]|eukprot:XP_015658621.1 hypothetical protein ABB37_05163 [Leptomonas pyrrhocoris]
MFAGHTFYVSLTTSPLTVAALTQRGGSVVYDVDRATSITCVVIANENVCSNAAASPAAPPCSSSSAAMRGGRGWAVRNKLPASAEDHIRAARVPVVYELWVHQCVRAGRPLLPCQGGPDVVAYNPFLFAGLRFTTTQLPLQLKANIVAILQFYGAEYHRHLLDTTNTVVYSHMQFKGVSSSANVSSSSSIDACPSGAVPHKSPPAAATTPTVTEAAAAPLTKLSVARERGMACVTPQWVQLCLNAGLLLPHAAPLVATLSTRSISLTDAAGGPGGSVEKAPCRGNDEAVADGAPALRSADYRSETQERADMEKRVADALDDVAAPVAAAIRTGADTTALLSSTVSSTPFTDNPASEDTVQPLFTNSSKTSRLATALEEYPEVRAALQLADRLAINAPARPHKRRRYR